MIIINCTSVPSSGNYYIDSPAIYLNGTFFWVGNNYSNYAKGLVYSPTISSGGKKITINHGHLVMNGTDYNYIVFF